MKLFLFSDHKTSESHPLDRRAIAATEKSQPSVTWIPSGGRPEKIPSFFAQRKAYYAELGITDVEMLPLHSDYDRSRVRDLLSRDIVHLSGGDPYVFLENLRATGVAELLQVRAKAGGVTVGDSGGAMLMMQDLAVCEFGEIRKPGGMTDTSALHLVDFDLHPHFGSYGATAQQLADYAEIKRKTVYGIPDGGVAVEGEQIWFHGQVAAFSP